MATASRGQPADDAGAAADYAGASQTPPPAGLASQLPQPPAPAPHSVTSSQRPGDAHAATLEAPRPPTFQIPAGEDPPDVHISDGSHGMEEGAMKPPLKAPSSIQDAPRASGETSAGRPAQIPADARSASASASCQGVPGVVTQRASAAAPAGAGSSVPDPVLIATSTTQGVVSASESSGTPASTGVVVPAPAAAGFLATPVASGPAGTDVASESRGGSVAQTSTNPAFVPAASSRDGPRTESQLPSADVAQKVSADAAPVGSLPRCSLVVQIQDPGLAPTQRQASSASDIPAATSGSTFALADVPMVDPRTAAPLGRSVPALTTSASLADGQPSEGSTRAAFSAGAAVEKADACVTNGIVGSGENTATVGSAPGSTAAEDRTTVAVVSSGLELGSLDNVSSSPPVVKPGQTLDVSDTVPSRAERPSGAGEVGGMKADHLKRSTSPASHQGTVRSELAGHHAQQAIRCVATNRPGLRDLVSADQHGTRTQPPLSAKLAQNNLSVPTLTGSEATVSTHSLEMDHASVPHRLAQTIEQAHASTRGLLADLGASVPHRPQEVASAGGHLAPSQITRMIQPEGPLQEQRSSLVPKSIEQLAESAHGLDSAYIGHPTAQQVLSKELDPVPQIGTNAVPTTASEIAQAGGMAGLSQSVAHRASQDPSLPATLGVLGTSGTSLLGGSDMLSAETGDPSVNFPHNPVSPVAQVVELPNRACGPEGFSASVLPVADPSSGAQSGPNVSDGMGVPSGGLDPNSILAHSSHLGFAGFGGDVTAQGASAGAAISGTQTPAGTGTSVGQPATAAASAAPAAGSSAPSGTPRDVRQPPVNQGVGRVGASASQSSHGGAPSAGSKLEEMRRQSRKLGEQRYLRGPGAKRPRPPGLPPGMVPPPTSKKEKKSQSAYVSRFAAKEYEELLEKAVREADAELAAGRLQNTVAKQDNADMREQIQALEAAVRGGLAAIRMRVATGQPYAVSPSAASLEVCPAAQGSGEIRGVGGDAPTPTAESSRGGGGSAPKSSGDASAVVPTAEKGAQQGEGHTASASGGKAAAPGNDEAGSDTDKLADGRVHALT